MPRGETGKRRQSRIELGYYKEPDAIGRWRARIIVLAIVLAGLWFGLAPIVDRGAAFAPRLFEWDRLASPGPLARVHATWESRCEACHDPFRSVTGKRWTSGGSADTHVSDVQCQACHAAAPHHPARIAGEVSGCAACHHDHRGREVSLVRMDDTQCTTCHADLRSHRAPIASLEQPVVPNSVTHFDRDPAHHPEFAAIGRADPGRLRFNHALHQTRGFTHEPGGKPFTFGQIAESERARYGWTMAQPLDTAVPPLDDCAACHRLEGSGLDKSKDRSATPTPSRSVARAGAYMMPVTYEAHCRACHPLAFDRGQPDKQVRHGLTPGEILDELRQYYAATAVEADPDRLRRYIPPRRKPGEPESPPLENLAGAIDDKVLTALKILFGSPVGDMSRSRENPPPGKGGCVECHHLSSLSSPEMGADAFRRLRIEPTNVNRVWFPHSNFDHAAHRALECVACHSQAKTSEKHTDVLLPGITNCVQCHGPARGRKSDARGGAGDSCTECHRYHRDDHSRGKTTPPRGDRTRMSIELFLRGGP